VSQHKQPNQTIHKYFQKEIEYHQNYLKNISESPHGFITLNNKSYKILNTKTTVKSPDIIPNNRVIYSPSKPSLSPLNKTNRVIMKSVDCKPTNIVTFNNASNKRTALMKSPQKYFNSTTTYLNNNDHTHKPPQNERTIPVQTTPKKKIIKYEKKKFYSRKKDKNIQEYSNNNLIGSFNQPQTKPPEIQPKQISRSVPRSPYEQTLTGKEVIIYKRDQSTGKIVRSNSRTIYEYTHVVKNKNNTINNFEPFHSSHKQMNNPQ
jgi:hypothetical protein